MVGKVFLVGAGPGDPELLTRKAHRLIRSATVIVLDRLVSDEIRLLFPASARVFDVGKSASNHTLPQEEINRLLVDLARTGLDVLRLKGGDPFVFGRGGEEALVLAASGIPFEVVPGITSAQGCAASLRVPLTHRGVATGLRFVTGHLRGDEALELDWPGLADPATTLVVYMGLSSIGEIAARLVVEGRDPSTPVLAVSHATQAQARHLLTSLRNVAKDSARARLDSPALFIVGEVAGLAAVLQAAGVDTGEMLDAAE